MTHLGDFALFIAIGVALAPLGILLHELGHAVAALRLTDGPVIMRIGGGRTVAARRLSPRFAAILGARPTAGGRVAHRPAATKRDAAIIVAAGPAATLVAGLVSGVLALYAYVHGAPRLALYALAAFTIDALGALLYNSGRNVIPQQSGRMQPTDGEQLARLAGARPTEEPRRTSPIAWILLAIVAGLTVVLAFDDPPTGVPMLLVLAFIFLRANRAERAR